MSKRTYEEMESLMEEIFRPMNQEVEGFRGIVGGFGQGHAIQAVAEKVAPEWLQKWHEKHRWLICFTQGWAGLVILADAFGWSKETLLADLIYYESLETRNEPTDTQSRQAAADR